MDTKSHFAMLLLGILIAIASASDESNSISNLVVANDFKQEIILDMMKRVIADLDDKSVFLHLPLVKKANYKKNYKSRKTKSKSNFRIFNINSLFNPARLWA